MRRLSSCGSRAQLLRGMWDLPRPGLEPVSPALAGRFSTTTPPGKPCFLFFYKFIYFILFILFLAALGLCFCMRAFLWFWQAGATLHCGAQASHCGGFSCCGAWALGTWASVVVAQGLSSCGSRALERRLSKLWHTGLVAPRHVRSSWTRARTHVPCNGRRILNHCATREAQKKFFVINNIITYQ